MGTDKKFGLILFLIFSIACLFIVYAVLQAAENEKVNGADIPGRDNYEIVMIPLVTPYGTTVIPVPKMQN